MAPKKQAKPEHVEGTEPEVEQELSTEVVLQNAVPDPDLEVELPIQSDGSLDDGFVSQSGVDLLEQLLGSSKAEESPKSGLVIPTPEEIEAVVNRDRLKGIAERMSHDDGLKQNIREAMEDVRKGNTLSLDEFEEASKRAIHKRHHDRRDWIGPQPNGDYGIVIQIKEGYWSGIQSQAESDNMTPEEWVTMRLAEYLDNWWGPAQSK